MSIAFAGAVIDVPVRDIDNAERFYTILMGRPPDLQVRPTEREWRLLDAPEVALRVIVDAARAGHSRVLLGVRDLGAERERLAESWRDVPEVQERPHVIALLALADPDGNAVTLWHDLLLR